MKQTNIDNKKQQGIDERLGVALITLTFVANRFNIKYTLSYNKSKFILTVHTTRFTGEKISELINAIEKSLQVLKISEPEKMEKVINEFATRLGK